jgi:hypothetical protein
LCVYVVCKHTLTEAVWPPRARRHHSLPEERKADLGGKGEVALSISNLAIQTLISKLPNRTNDGISIIFMDLIFSGI